MRSFRDKGVLAAALGGAVLLLGAGLLLWADGTARLAGDHSSAAGSPVTPRSPEFEFTSLPSPRPLPALAFTDADGAAKTLADFKGRIVLLNIWATWCVPCRPEMPALDRLQARLGGSDFQVLALSIDRKGIEAVKPFYLELGLGSLGIYLDQSGAAARVLDTVGVPTTLLIDREGREVGRKLGPAPWDEPDAVALVRRAIEAER
jgi:thiol-disulfide isomerase/thioredoxin